MSRPLQRSERASVCLSRDALERLEAARRALPLPESRSAILDRLLRTLTVDEMVARHEQRVVEDACLVEAWDRAGLEG